MSGLLVGLRAGELFLRWRPTVAPCGSLWPCAQAAAARQLQMRHFRQLNAMARVRPELPPNTRSPDTFETRSKHSFFARLQTVNSLEAGEAIDRLAVAFHNDKPYTNEPRARNSFSST